MAAGLTDNQKRHYEEQGYVFLRQLFTPAEIQPLIDEIKDAISEQGQRYYDEGRLSSLYEDDGFETRFMKLVEDCGDIYNELVGSALMGPELFKILSSPQLVDIAECIVGPGSPLRGATPAAPQAAALRRGRLPMARRHAVSGAPHNVRAEAIRTGAG